MKLAIFGAMGASPPRMIEINQMLKIAGLLDRPARQLGMQLETRETPEDLGFKVFKLASSNYKQWDVAAIDVAAIHVAAIHELPPPTWRVTDPDKGQSFHLTLAGKIALKDLRPLDLKKDNLFICRDIALDDEAAANLALQCRLKTI